jgi:hypothetical protein
MKLNKDELKYLEMHKEIYLEFEDLLKSDPNFNYNENEFIEWLKDYNILGGGKK